MMSLSSESCQLHEHGMCDLFGCDCVCHLYRPRADLGMWRILLIALCGWALVFFGCIYISGLFS